MAIVNATDDSFYQKSRLNKRNLEDKIKKIKTLQPDIIDIGGQSTRPGAPLITPKEEIARIVPVIERINNFFEGPISIDTFRSEVAEEAIKAGASIINDVSGGQLDAAIFDVAAQYKVPYVLTHMRGTPDTMQKQTDYQNLIVDLKQYFSEKIRQLHAAGVHDLILDPGFGFAKTPQQNLRLIKLLQQFRSFGYPVLIGVSRKSTIQRFLNTNAENALNGTSILHTLALQNGAGILRVHDILEAQECIRLYEAYKNA